MNKSLMILPIVFALAVVGAIMIMDTDDSDGATTNPSGSTKVGDLWYTVYNGNAIVRGPSNSNLTTIVIPSTVEINGTTYNVTGIAGSDSSTYGAFTSMYSLTSVTIPSSVTSLSAKYSSASVSASYAFAFCYYLKNIIWDLDNTSLTEIGAYAFYNCDLSEVTELPRHLRVIKDSAFASAKFPLTYLPESIRTIEKQAFYNCQYMTLTELPSRLTDIPDNAFAGCHQITIDKLPSGVTSVGYNAFSGCDNITSLTLPSSLTTIGALAFCNMGVSQFTIPSSVQSIGISAFCTPPTMKEFMITINGNPTIGSSAFGISGTKDVYKEVVLILNGNPTFDEKAFCSSTNDKYPKSIQFNIANKGSTVIEPGMYGLPGADSDLAPIISDSYAMESISMLQDVGQRDQHETIVTEDDSAASTVLRAVPIFVILAIITGIILAYMRTTRV